MTSSNTAQMLVDGITTELSHPPLTIFDEASGRDVVVAEFTRLEVRPDQVACIIAAGLWEKLVANAQVHSFGTEERPDGVHVFVRNKP